MKLFAQRLASRRDQKELGLGVWRRAHDRFRRGVDRFHQVLEHVRDQDLLTQTVPVANEFADLLARVRAVCMTAQSFAPTDGQDIPPSDGGWLHDLHRELSRAGNDLAQAAEVLAMARFRGTAEPTQANRQSMDALTRRVAVVSQRVLHAEELLHAHRGA